jgi:GMC oxidoreductase
MIIPTEDGHDLVGHAQPLARQGDWHVADASIIPEVPSATTNVTVIMLAELIYQRVDAS